jgi:hypothetical protein
MGPIQPRPGHEWAFWSCTGPAPRPPKRAVGSTSTVQTTASWISNTARHRNRAHRGAANGARGLMLSPGDKPPLGITTAVARAGRRSAGRVRRGVAASRSMSPLNHYRVVGARSREFARGGV